jgi:hypothetical protein
VERKLARRGSSASSRTSASPPRIDPLDEQHAAVVALGVEAETHHVAFVPQAVEVGVRNGRLGVVLVNEREGRARHAHPRRQAERAAERSREERFAAAERSGQYDEITWREQGSERDGERAGGSTVWKSDGGHRGGPP